MDRTSFGNTAAIISGIDDPNRLVAMLRDPRYAGFTSVILAKLQEIKTTHSGVQAMQPQQPPVAQQIVQGAAAPEQQNMARGGIIAFKHGGEVKGYAGGGDVDYASRWGAGTPNAGKSFRDYLRMKPIMYPAPVDYPTTAPVSSAAVQATGSSYTPATAPTQYPSSAELLSGLDSISGRRGSAARTTQGTYMPPANQSDKRDIKSAADQYADLQNMIGPNADMESAKAELAAIGKGREQQMAQAPWMAVMRAGLGMAQAGGENPRAGFLGNLATGATAGLGQYQTEREALDKQRIEALKDAVAMGVSNRAERVGLARDSLLGYKTDVNAANMLQMERERTAAQLAGDRIRAAAQEKFANAPLQLQQLAFRTGSANYDAARQAYMNDPTKNPPPGNIEDHIGRAIQALSAQYGIAGLRGDTAASRDEAGIYSKAENLQPGSGARAVQQYRTQQQGGAGSTAPIADYTR